MPLDQTSIVKTAIRLLDRIGLESLSMRRLADELGVHVSALYWHFKNKEALIDTMAKEIARPFSENELLDELSWDASLKQIATSWREMMLSHRDGALVVTSARPQAEDFVFMERLLTKLLAAGFTESSAIQGFFTVTSYVLGFVIEEQRGPKAKRSPINDRMIDGTPLFRASARTLSNRNLVFERGLQLILTGMQGGMASKK